MIPVRTSVEVDEIPGAVVGLIIANVAVFLIQIGVPENLREAIILNNALVPARYTDPGFARHLGLEQYNFLPLLTNTFMHVGWWHLILNMWTLWLFGRPLEERLGAPRFVLFYLLCGAIASLAHFAVNFDSHLPALGASGAVAGVLGAYTLLYPRAKVVVLTPVLFFPVAFPLPAVVYTAIWFVLQLVQGMATLAADEPAGGIAWWAHIGGFLAGLALVKALGAPGHKPRRIGPPRRSTLEIGPQRAGAVRFGAKRLRLKLPVASRRSTLPSRAAAPPPAAGHEPAPSGGPWETDRDSAAYRLGAAAKRALSEMQKAAAEPRQDTERRGPWG